jgi:hypothetical protein
MTPAERHKQIKEREKLYRAAAARLYNTSPTGLGNVAQMEDGAFVDISIWVPLEEIEPVQSIAEDPLDKQKARG